MRDGARIEESKLPKYNVFKCIILYEDNEIVMKLYLFVYPVNFPVNI